MTVNISKHLLGIACIAAGAFIPLILSMLTLMFPEFESPGSSKANPIHQPDTADGPSRHRAGEPP